MRALPRARALGRGSSRRVPVNMLVARPLSSTRINDTAAATPSTIATKLPSRREQWMLEHVLSPVLVRHDVHRLGGRNVARRLHVDRRRRGRGSASATGRRSTSGEGRSLTVRGSTLEFVSARTSRNPRPRAKATPGSFSSKVVSSDVAPCSRAMRDGDARRAPIRGRRVDARPGRRAGRRPVVEPSVKKFRNAWT